MGGPSSPSTLRACRVAGGAAGSGAEVRRADALVLGEFAARARKAADARDQALHRINLDIVEVDTNRPYVDALVAFFKARAKRLGHA